MKRDGFGSKIGVIAATAGSAVGLGNIWKFPYVTGLNGGAAFLLVYLLCVVLIGLPIVISEFSIGRAGKANVVRSFRNLVPKKFWGLTGILSTITTFIILSFYSMIAGWVLAYIFKSVTGKLSSVPTEQLPDYFNSLISEPMVPILCTLLVLCLTAFIVISGVKNGIEKYSKILMPILFVLLIVLMVRSLSLEGASKGLEFLFKPNFSKLTTKGVLEALGHSFYSLSIAMGILVTFGSYIGEKEDIVNLSISVTITDTLVALMAGVVIFPAVFAYGFEPEAGPKLIFITLPAVFKSMPLGNLFETLFFILIAIAAITSTIALLEVVVAVVTEEFNLERKKATILISLGLFVLAIPSILSFGPWSHIKIFGKGFFDLFDFIASNVFLPLGGFMVCIFVAFAWGTNKVKEEVFQGKSSLIIKTYSMIIKYLAPIAIVVIFIYFTGVLKI